MASVNNTSLKQQATVENFLEFPPPTSHTHLGKTADEKYHPHTSPRAEIIWRVEAFFTVFTLAAHSSNKHRWSHLNWPLAPYRFPITDQHLKKTQSGEREERGSRALASLITDPIVSNKIHTQINRPNNAERRLIAMGKGCLITPITDLAAFVFQEEQKHNSNRGFQLTPTFPLFETQRSQFIRDFVEYLARCQKNEEVLLEQ